MMEDQSHIEPGRRLKLRTADGDIIERIATSGVQRGAKTLVVWICTDDEWAARSSPICGRPWPLNAVESVLDTIEAR